MVLEEILAYGDRLRSTPCREFIIWNYADPLTSLKLFNYYLTLAMSSGRFYIHTTLYLHIVISACAAHAAQPGHTL